MAKCKACGGEIKFISALLRTGFASGRPPVDRGRGGRSLRTLRRVTPQ
jgi:hypothetical protein